MLCINKKCVDKKYKIVVKERIIGSTTYNMLDSAETYNDVATIYGSVSNVNPYKFYNGVATTTPYTHIIKTEFNELLTKQNLRFAVGNLNLNLVSINFKATEFDIELYCVTEEKINGSNNNV